MAVANRAFSHREIPNGGARATAAISDDHAERLALQSVSDLIADSVFDLACGGKGTVALRTTLICAPQMIT
jgi:hypothetical protein